MTDPDAFLLQLEALAIAARLRRQGDIETAVMVERWADGPEFRDQLAARPTQS